MRKLFVIIVMILSSKLLPAETTIENCSYNLADKKWSVGLGSRFTEVNSLSAAFVGVSGSYNLSENFEIGVKAEGLYYDRKLNKLSNDKTYHLQSGHAGFFVEWHPFGKGDIHFSIPLFMGTGEVSYLYDKEYRKDLIWYEEIIDKTIYSIFQIGVQGEARVYKNWSVALDFGIRNTSPIEMLGTDKDLFNNYEGGLTIKYNF